MKKIIFLSLLISITSCSKPNEQEDKKAVIEVLRMQEQKWSNHDIEGYMEGYWKSDSLKFYGANGLTYGWQKTLDNYKKRYPTKGHTGTLNFKVNDITRISDDAYYVMGEYHLTRPIGNANGVFMIILKKIDGKWKVVADTSC